MHHRAPRGLLLFAILLVLFLGVAALVPLTARGAAQIVGIVSTCGGPLPFVDSVTVTLVDVSAPSSTTVSLAGTSVLFGHVRDSDLVPISVGVVAWLYNPAAANTSISRLIPATVGGSLYQFETARTPNGAYTLIVDANGYRSSSQFVTVTGTPTLLDVTLQPAAKAPCTTTFAYRAADRN